MVPELWPGSTIVCIASGSSMSATPIDLIRHWREIGGCRVIAINDNIKLAPWADILYFADVKWWKWHRELVRNFSGLKFSIDNHGAERVTDRDVIVLDDLNFCTTTSGRISRAPHGIYTGRNSGYQAINIAVLLGAKRIVLVGYDMQPGPKGQVHWFGNHPEYTRMDYQDWRLEFNRMSETAERMNIEILNATVDTALECFKRVTLESLLSSENSAVLSA